MPDRTCAHPDCVKPHKARGLCQTHYRRVQRTGQVGLRPPDVFFWAKVDRRGPEDCWLWTGAKSGTGYGVFRGEKAHRFSARLAGMSIDDALVRHHCDTPLCVNPAHLQPGTHDDNMRDAVDRKRMPRGERQRSAKLRETDIPAILEMAKAGYSYREIGERFGVTKYNIYHIVNRKTWKDVAAA